MTRDQVKEILNRVLAWPSERQAKLAHVVELMKEHDNGDLRLSDEQVAQVNRRLADPNPKSLARRSARALCASPRMKVTVPS
jgi:hypothetical protein